MTSNAMAGGRWDAVIVGGGLAGLAAAAYLARSGRRVAVFDSGPLGGRARTEIRDGHCFNLGAHALYLGGSAAEVLSELGISYTGGPPASTGRWATRGQELFEFPADAPSLLRTRMLGPWRRRSSVSCSSGCPA